MEALIDFKYYVQNSRYCYVKIDKTAEEKSENTFII
jgi:hypothetical protein